MIKIAVKITNFSTQCTITMILIQLFKVEFDEPAASHWDYLHIIV